MRVAMFNGLDRPITIEEQPQPSPGPGELLVKVHRCGICGSDVSMTSGGPLSLPLGRFGHEWAGEVVEVGSGVEGFALGARIAALPVARCGVCTGCETGNPLFCEANGFLVGGFGEFMVVPQQAAIRLPRSLSFTDGALVEPMSCGLHALQFAQIERGAKVLVIGAGAMALSAVFWARRLGAARVAVLSRSARRKEICLQMGADAVLGFDEDDQARIAEMLGGAPDIVAEGVGKEGMLGLAAQHVRPRGAIVSMGMCQHRDPVVPAHLTSKEAKILFPRGYTVEEFEETARTFDADDIDPGIMVSDIVPLATLPEVMTGLHDGTRKGLKIHVDPTL